MVYLIFNYKIKKKNLVLLHCMQLYCLVNGPYYGVPYSAAAAPLSYREDIKP